MKTRRWLVGLSAAALALCLAGCAGGGTTADTSATDGTAEAPATQDAQGAGTSAGQNTGTQTQEADDQSATSASDMPAVTSDVLVVYFSRTGEQYGVGVIDKGNTAIVADMIIEATGADSFEVLPEDDYYPYTYQELTEVARQEQADGARPAYKGDAPDLSQYDTIFIGAPVWWGDWPMIMYTFFENNADALAGKTLIPFCTHAGSGLSGFDTKLASALPDSTVGTGFAALGSDAQNNAAAVQEQVTAWLEGLGF